MIPRVGRPSVQRLVAIPRDALVGHRIRFVIGVIIVHVDQLRAHKGVVEDRVRNETAGIICEAFVVQL